MSDLSRHAMSACAALMTSLLLVASALPPL